MGSFSPSGWVRKAERVATQKTSCGFPWLADASSGAASMYVAALALFVCYLKLLLVSRTRRPNVESFFNPEGQAA